MKSKIIAAAVGFLVGVVSMFLLVKRADVAMRAQSAKRLLLADFDGDGRVERIFIDDSQGTPGIGTKYLVVMKNDRELLRVEYFMGAKEPPRNSSVAINSEGPKQHLLVKGGPKGSESVYEFRDGTMQVVPATESDGRILRGMSPFR